MVTIKRILYPIDFSAVSYGVLPYVLSLAEKYGAEICLLHVVDDLRRFADLDIPRESLGDFVRKSMQAAEDRLQSICTEHLQGCPRFQRLLVLGDARVEIVKTAADKGADLVVMGTHGYRGLKGALLGSVAAYVVRHSPVPVLVVPGGKESGGDS